jgi:PAS domain S-box-containing protein
MLGCYFVSRYNYVFFHTIVELSACVVGCAVLMLFWNARRHLDNGFFLLLATACLATSILGFVHVLTYDGMPVFPGVGGNESIQAKTIGQWMASLSFLVAPFFLRRKINPAVVLGVYAAGVALALAAIFSHVLPTLSLERSGMTGFEQASRGLSCIVFLAAAGLLARKSADLDSGVLRLLIASLIASSASEAASALSADWRGSLKVLAHLSQVLSVFFLYRAFIEAGLTNPYSLLSKAHKERLDALLSVEQEKTAILGTAHGWGMLFMDTHMRIIRCSDSMHNAFARSGESLLGRNFHEVIGCRSSGCVRCGVGKRCEPIEVQQCETTAHDGSTWIFHRNPLGGKDGTVPGVIAIGIDITKRREAEETLRDREARLEKIVSNASEIIYTLSLEGTVTFTSPAWTDKLGWEVSDILGKSFTPFVHPDDLPTCWSAIQKAMITGKPERGIEYRMRHKDGTWRWHTSAGSMVMDDQGRPLYFVGIAEDITQRKLADEAQARSVSRLEAVNWLQEQLMLQAPVQEKAKVITEAAVSLLDLDFCRIWRVMPGDLCDSGCIHATAADEVLRCVRHDKCLHLIASSGRYTHIDGDHRRVPLGAFKIGRIAAGEERKFLTNSVTTDPRVHNHEWARSLGLASFAGYKLRDARENTTGVLAAFAKHPISDEDDAILSHLAETTSKVIIDQQAAEELRQAQKLEGVGQLAGGVAHEFNNLLQVIGGYTGYAMEGLDPQEERYRDLEQVLKASERATALTRQLLGFSRRRVLEPKPTDANLLVRDLVKLVRPAIGEHISLELALAEDAGTVYADSGELEQAILNLCVNARDAMPSGGTILLKTERVFLTEPFWDPQVDLAAGPYVVFSVADTGCGIPRDIQQRVFEPFFTTKEVGKGTGLGLAMVYGIVRQHKGAIHLYSEVGIGTTFKLYLPVGDGDTEETCSEEPQFGPLGKETILVAEDDPMVRSLSVRTLTRAGYTVLAAADGEEALRVFEENSSVIALVVLDAIMPNLTGHEVHCRIKHIAPDTKVVCCTGYDRGTAQAGCLVRENVPFIQKPFTPHALLSAVRTALDTKTPCQLTPQTTP